MRIQQPKSEACTAKVFVLNTRALDRFFSPERYMDPQYEPPYKGIHEHRSRIMTREMIDDYKTLRLEMFVDTVREGGRGTGNGERMRLLCVRWLSHGGGTLEAERLSPRDPLNGTTQQVKTTLPHLFDRGQLQRPFTPKYPAAGLGHDIS